MIYTNELVQKAYDFAKIAHEGQIRKFTGNPYIEHPVEVAEILSEYSDDPEVIAAGLLHDVVEDTDHTLDEIRELFGERVATLVENMTDISKPEDGNRVERRAIDREHSSQSSPDGKLIKLCDVFANTRDIMDTDKAFALMYVTEKLLLIKVLATESNYDLYMRVSKHLNSCYLKLKA